MYRRKNISDRLFNFEKIIDDLTNINNKISIIIENFEFKTKIEYDDKKRVASILNKIRKSKLDFYSHHEAIFLIKKCQTRRSDNMIKKFSEHSRWVEDIKDQFSELNKC